MSIIIDGYNLLYGAGIVVETPGPYTLEKSRQALLNFLRATLDDRDLAQTTVVFDAQNAPPGLPSSYSQAGITILFADRREDADTLIAQLIGQHTAPKSLLVVSSDHAVQRAAKRRKARFCDSDRWFATMVRERHAPHPASTDDKPTVPLAAEEIAQWVETFSVGLDDLAHPTTAHPTTAHPTTAQTPALDPDPGRTSAASDRDAAKTELEEQRFNPFPDGYGEDLLNEDE